MVDTYTQPVTTKRQYRSLEEKLRIVQEALSDGASVASGAGARSQRELTLQLVPAVSCGATKLLPVRISGEGSTALSAASHEPDSLPTSSSGTIHIQLPRAQVRVEGNPDAALLRVLLECLQS
jgi:hypothetical protein